MAYFSNGSEGMILDEQCSECPIGIDQKNELTACPIAWVQMEYNYTQVNDKPMTELLNCLVNKDGVCQIRELVKDKIKEGMIKVVGANRNQIRLDL